MRRDAAPLCAALLAVALAALVHPSVFPRLWLPAAAGVPLALLLALAAHWATRNRASAVLAAGIAIVACALAGDVVVGRRGTVDVAVGAPRRSMAETSGGGNTRLRPLGFEITTDGSGLFVDGQRLLPGRASRWQGHRVGAGERLLSGDAERVRLAIGEGAARRELELRPGQTAEVDDLQLTLDRYFADLAQDARQQPFTMSAQPRNPAALLDVARGDRRSSVLLRRGEVVRPDALLPALALVAVVPAYKVRVRVSREPCAPVVVIGLGTVLAGVVALAARERRWVRITAALVCGSVVATGALGLRAWLVSGSYVDAPPASALAAALLGIAALQPTLVAPLLRLLLAAALAWVARAPGV